MAFSVFAGFDRHGLGIETEPFHGFESRRMKAHAFHERDEVEDVAAPFAFAEAVPDIFAYAHPELSRVLAFMNWAPPAQAISGFLEPVKPTSMLEHLLRGDGRFDGLEVDER